MATPLLTIDETAESDFQTGQVLSIAGGHFMHDVYSAFFAPLLPVLIEKLSLTLTLAGSLNMFMQAPALLQPFIGYLADKVSLRYFVIFAPAVTATLMSCLGLAPNYFTLAVLLTLTGISVAIFHAPAPAMIAQVTGKQVGRGMSYFMAAGELARTVGPLLVVWGVGIWGLEGIYRLMLIGWATTLILYWRLRDVAAHTAPQGNIWAMLPAFRRMFIPLTFVVIFRAFLFGTLPAYLPTYMVDQGASLETAGRYLAILELAGVAGALLSGTISDRLGRKPVVAVTLSTVLTLIFLNVSGWWMIPALLALGFVLLATQPVLLAMVQEHYPESRAVANGLYLSLSFLTRMIAVLLVGVAGDQWDLRTAFLISAPIPLLALPAIWLLPELSGDKIAAE
jgi:FSR family fosmidomycin resistance protein-like MFS transporter